MSENKIKELEDEIQSIHDSIEEEQAELIDKREKLKYLKDPNWKEKEEQLKIKIFMEKANFNLKDWILEEEEGTFKGSYIHNSRTMAISVKPIVALEKTKYKKILVNLYQIREMVNFYLASDRSSYLKIYLENDSKLLIFSMDDIFGYLAPCEEDEDDEFEESKEVGSKNKTEFGKIQELQKLINRAKNLIFAALDIDWTIKYPYCKELEKDSRYDKSMSDELLDVRSTLEWIDNICWAYQRLKQ